MTREDVIVILKGFKDNPLFSDIHAQAFDMAISALSAEPCREADDYENEIEDLHNRLDIAEYDKERYKEEITTLEAENKGEWIAQQETNGDDYFEAWDISGKHTFAGKYKCNRCGFITICIEDRGLYNFCPNCGADMRGDI